jgi:hypothetical protein
MQVEDLGSLFLFLSKFISPGRLQFRSTSYAASTEAKFLGVIGTKIIRVFLLAIHQSPALTELKQVFNVNEIVRS